MSVNVLQINFTCSTSKDEYEQLVSSLAAQFAAVAGLRWKIWIMNEPDREAGGIYLFDNEASVTAFLEGPLVAAVTSHPALSQFSVKRFDVLESVTAATRGPIPEVAAA